MRLLSLMPHQEQILQKTEPLNHVAFYLDMGLGKTFAGSAKMYDLNNAVNLVICQKSKIDDWIDHFREYYSGARVFNLTKAKEAEAFQQVVGNWISQDDFIIGVVNYETAFRRPYLLKLEGFTLMLDESQLISNETAKRSKFVLKLKPESVILLSGTPTAGKYEKLWSQLMLLGWNISKDAFWNSYVVTEWVEAGDNGYHMEVVRGYKNVDHLKRKLTQYGAIFMKTEEVLQLPEQIEQKLMFNQTKDYRSFLKHSYLEFEDGTELVGDNTLTCMLYSRQLCGQYHEGKLQGLYDLAESTEDRLIIFYNFTEELRRMQTILADLDRPYSVVNGQTKDLEAYEEHSDSITFLQYQAGAYGLNMQKANKIIYFTLPLGKGSCDLWEQSKKRIHRIGQHQPCFYYYLLVSRSIEEFNLASLKLGKELTDDLFKKEER